MATQNLPTTGEISEAEFITPTESTSLLSKSATGHSTSGDLTSDEGAATSSSTAYSTAAPTALASWLAEIWVLIRVSIPVILSYTLQNSLQTTSVLIVGRLGPEALATAAFSYMFAMSTAWLIALGGTTALDTLASTSYTGSIDKHDLGILL